MQRGGGRVAHLILIVDDEPLNRKLLRKMALNSGYETVEASDGREAIEGVKQHKPALVLMDLLMPNMDGVQATRLIKGDPETAHIPVFGLSGMAMEEDQRKAFEAGCIEFFAKPLDLDSLRDAIAMVMMGAAEKEN